MESMEAPAIQVETFEQPLSRKARWVNAILQFMFRRLRLEHSDAGLIRLRTQVAVIDRVMGLMRITRGKRRWQWRRRVIGRVRTRVVRVWPVTPDEPAVLVYLHGGAFFLRSFNQHMAVAAEICLQAGLVRAYLPIYRLAPEHPFPAAVDDCFDFYRGLLQSGVPAHRMVLAGDSAGGGLALKLLMRLRDQGLALPACGILISPFTDLSCSGDSIKANVNVDPLFGALPSMHARFYVGRHDAQDPRCSPLFGNFSRLPPLLAQVGSTERLLDDSLRLLPRVRRAGGTLRLEVWQGVPHVWHALRLPESSLAIASIGEFASTCLRRAESTPPSGQSAGVATPGRAARNSTPT